MVLMIIIGIVTLSMFVSVAFDKEPIESFKDEDYMLDIDDEEEEDKK